jgi:hypothetical protein
VGSDRTAGSSGKKVHVRAKGFLTSHSTREAGENINHASQDVWLVRTAVTQSMRISKGHESASCGSEAVLCKVVNLLLNRDSRECSRLRVNNLSQ